MSYRALLCVLVRSIAATILMVSAVSHMLLPYHFCFVLASYRVVPAPFLTFLPFGVSGATFAVGLLLLTERGRAILWTAAAIFASFASIQCQAVARGLSIGCGCFGYSSHEISAWSIALPTVAALCCGIIATQNTADLAPIRWRPRLFWQHRM
jgi:hypothetical protein